MNPAAGAAKLAFAFISVTVLGAILGIVLAVFLGLFRLTYIANHTADLPFHFWQYVLGGFFAGLGAAVGFGILNRLIGFIDRTKNYLMK